MHVWLIRNTIQITQYAKKSLERQPGTSEVDVMEYFHCSDRYQELRRVWGTQNNTLPHKNSRDAISISELLCSSIKTA